MERIQLLVVGQFTGSPRTAGPSNSTMRWISAAFAFCLRYGPKPQAQLKTAV